MAPRSPAPGPRRGPPNLTGALKGAGYTDVVFIDAMTDHVDDDALRARLAELKPDIVGVTAITPAIYKAERVLEVAKEVVPNAVRILGGIHATFMFKQVLSEAPWIDAIVRGEGEAILLNLVKAVDEGQWPQARDSIEGLAFRDGETIRATKAAPTIKDLDSLKPDWSILEWSKYIYTPLNVRVAIPSMARGAPSPAASAASGSSGATTATATRRRWSTRLKSSSPNTAWASSSSRTKSRRFTRRSSSSSAKSSSRVGCLTR